MSEEDAQKMINELPNWQIINGHHLERRLSFPDFVSALAFVNDAGAICEEQGHHADFELAWGRVIIQIFTHKVDGITESDFILASLIEEVM